MNTFDETKVKRAGDGRFAEKTAAAEASGIDLSEQVEPISAGLIERGWRRDAATPGPDGRISVTSVSESGPEHGAAVEVAPAPDGTWTMTHSSWARDPDNGIVDGDTITLESGMDESRASTALADYVDAANDSSEFEVPFDVRPPAHVAYRPSDDPWANG